MSLQRCLLHTNKLQFTKRFCCSLNLISYSQYNNVQHRYRQTTIRHFATTKTPQPDTHDSNIAYKQSPPATFNEPLYTDKQSNTNNTHNTDNEQHTTHNRSRLFNFTKYTVGTVVIGYATFRLYELYDPNTCEKVRRITYFWSRMLPIYLHYKFKQKIQLKLFPPSSDEECDAIWNDMHERYADTVLNLVLHQRGVYIKLAQIGAVKPDIVPLPYCKRFEVLQDGVPPQPGEYARTMIQMAFNRSVDTLFSEFNDTAIGSATIGQVHSAKLLDGTPCVVKIQYPEVRRLFASDMSTLKAFVRLAQPEHLPMFQEMADAFEIEFDFVREAQYMDVIHDEIKRNKKYSKYIDIPHSINGLVSQYVLVMTKLDGIKMIDGLRREQAKLAKKQGKTVEQMNAEMKQQMLQNKRPDFKAPNPYLVAIYSTMLSITNKTINSFIALYNYTLAYITRHPLQYREHHTVINPVQIIDLLNDVHSYELFVLGVVNCDPHPGNILLLNNGKVGLIDYGQTQVFTLEHRCKLARMFQLLAQNDYDGISEHYKHMGLITRKMDPYVINKLAQLGFNDDGLDVTEGMNAQLFFEALGERDETLVVPDGYLMASRIGMLLRGLGSWIGVPHTTAQKFLPNADLCLKQNQAVWNQIKCC